MLEQIVLVKPRGFCAGVARAVKTLDLAIAKSQKPVYMRHQIVHNRKVVADFVKKGVKFVEDLNKVPDGSVVVFSAHGSPPSLYKEAEKKQLAVIDATCPLVVKVHQEAKRFVANGYFVIYIGHQGHPEPAGVLGEIPKASFVLIETLADAKKLELKQNKIVVLSQTTLSFDDTKEIIDHLKLKWPHLELPPVYDVCFATQNRQQAVKELARKTEVVLVIGSKESSNSNKLREVAEREGARAYLIDGPENIDYSWLADCQKLGITAGASGPETLVQAVAEKIKARMDGEIVEHEVLKEAVEFPNLPEALSRL